MEWKWWLIAIGWALFFGVVGTMLISMASTEAVVVAIAGGLFGARMTAPHFIRLYKEIRKDA